MTPITKQGILQWLFLSLLFLSIPLACQEDDDEPGINQPRITSITPAQGVVGTEVTIAGENFGTSITTNTVRFNGVDAVVNSATATQLKATVPANATTGLVSLTVNGVTVNGPQFQVVSPLYPSLTEAAIPDVHPGSYLTLSGTDFTSTEADDYKVGTTSTSLFFETIEVGSNFIKVRVPENFSVGTYEIGLFHLNELMDGRLNITVRNPALTASPNEFYAGAQITLSIDMVLSDDPEDYEVQMGAEILAIGQIILGQSTTTLAIIIPTNLSPDMYNVLVTHQDFTMQTQVVITGGYPGNYDFIDNVERETIMIDQFDNNTANPWGLYGSQIDGGSLIYVDDTFENQTAYLNQTIDLNQNYQVEFYKEGSGSFRTAFKGLVIDQHSSGVLYIGLDSDEPLAGSLTGKFTIRKVGAKIYWFVNETLVKTTPANRVNANGYFIEFSSGISHTSALVLIDWIEAEYIR